MGAEGRDRTTAEKEVLQKIEKRIKVYGFIPIRPTTEVYDDLSPES